MGAVRESAAAATERSRRARGAARRAEAVALLNIAGGTIGYCVTRLSDGLSPEQARVAAVEAAAELEAVAAALYRLTRLAPADRRAQAVLLTGAGMTRREVAVRLGVCERTVRYYLSSDGR